MADDRKKKLKPDRIVEQVAPDPADVPDVRVLIGFLGKSARKNCWRLYTNPNLNEFVEFPEDAVVHCESLEEGDGRLGGSVVWVKRETNLQRTATASREAQSDFLQGALAARISRHAGVNTAGAFAALRPGGGFQPGSIAVHASCVREFCDFVAVSFLGGGDVYCTGSFQCSNSWQAEC